MGWFGSSTWLLTHIEPIAHRDESDAPVLKKAQKCIEILVIPRQSRRIINKHSVELLVFGATLQRLKPRPGDAAIDGVCIETLESELGYRVLRLPAELVRNNVAEAVARIIAVLSVAT